MFGRRLILRGVLVLGVAAFATGTLRAQTQKDVPVDPASFAEDSPEHAALSAASIGTDSMGVSIGADAAAASPALAKGF